jgi:hypothetical protein
MQINNKPSSFFFETEEGVQTLQKKRMVVGMIAYTQQNIALLMEGPLK